MTRSTIEQKTAGSLAVLLAGLALSAATAGAVTGPPSSPLASPAQPARVKGPVPASLRGVESAAEDIIDLAFQKRRADAVTKAGELRNAAHGPAATALARAGVSPMQIAELQQRSDRLARLARTATPLRVALAANAVSALMPKLFARYSEPVPASVLALDYLDRETQLRSLAGERSRVSAAVAGLAETWSRLRPIVVRAGGVAVAKEYDRHVAAVQRLARASSGAALQREAVRGLGLVDSLEGVFRG